MNSKQDLEAFLRELKMIFRFGGKQKTELIKNIEKLTFWAGDNEKLHFAKQELLSQINNLDISISGKGFFVINRQFLAGVSLGKTVDHFQNTIMTLFTMRLFPGTLFSLSFLLFFHLRTDGRRLLYVHHHFHSVLFIWKVKCLRCVEKQEKVVYY